MARSGRKGPAGDPKHRSRRRSAPNEGGLRSLGSLTEGLGQPGTAPGAGSAAAPAGPSVADAPATVGAASTTSEVRASSSTYDESSLVLLGKMIEDKSRPVQRRARRRRRAKWVVASFAAVASLLVGSSAGYAWYLNHEIHRIDVKGLDSVATTGADAGTENILMVGSTDRCALKVQLTAYGLCGSGVDGVNSDVVMILHLDPRRHTVAVLSIPRDLFVPNARTTGAYKIDAALYQGPTQLVAAVEDDFGIPIQHYVVLNFDTFANVVNALGGVKMYFPEPVYDSYSDLDEQSTGCVHLDGYHALQVVRARHLQYKPPGVTTDHVTYWPYEGQSDLARIRRDHEFLRVLATAVAQKGVSNPVSDEQMVSSVAPQLTTDSQFSAEDMVNLVLKFHSVNVDNAPQWTLPVEVDSFGNYIYDGSSYGDVEFPSIVQDQQVIDQFLGVSPTTGTINGKPLPAPSSVKVSVVNGTGAYNQAAYTGFSLLADGFHITGIGEARSVGAESETVVYYPQATPADEAEAQAVADTLSGAVIMAVGPTTSGAQVTVVTGSQFSVDAPPASTSTTSTSTGSSPSTTSTSSGPDSSSGSTTSTSTGSESSPSSTSGSASTSTPGSRSTPSSESNGAFAPVSPAVTPLQPWDPRGCTAFGGEGT